MTVELREQTGRNPKSGKPSSAAAICVTSQKLVGPQPLKLLILMPASR